MIGQLKVIIVDHDEVGIPAADRIAELPVERYRTADSFLAAFEPGACGCLVLEATLPGTSGLAVQHRLHGDGIRVPTIMVSSQASIAMAVEAMRHGAHTFLEKPVTLEQLSSQVSEAMSEQAAFREKLSSHTRALRQLAKLTDKERDVLNYVLAGKTNKEMAGLLGLSLRGVEDRRARVMKKLEAESVAHLVSLVRLADDPDRPS